MLEQTSVFAAGLMHSLVANRRSLDLRNTWLL